MTRELVYTGFMSLDGVMQAEGHRGGDWLFDIEFLPEAYALKEEELAETSALMFGRHSYEAFAPIWPESDDHVAYKEIPKIIVSTTLADDAVVEGWGPITILRSTEDVAKLKQGDGGAIFIHGSLDLAVRLADADLIDRYNLLMWPVLLGAGKSAFPRTEQGKQKLHLRESAAYSNGVAKLVYELVR